MIAVQGRTQDLELGGAHVAYPGFQRGGCLKSGPHTKSEGGGALQVRYTKSGGASGPIYEKWGGRGGGGGGGASGPI